VNKTDWLHLFIKALGLYLIVNNIPTLVTTTFSLVMVLSQAANPNLNASRLFLWQGPIVSIFSIGIGLFLILQTKPIARWALGDIDKKS
jgi:hypothetical protein